LGFLFEACQFVSSGSRCCCRSSPREDEVAFLLSLISWHAIYGICAGGSAGCVRIFLVVGGGPSVFNRYSVAGEVLVSFACVPSYSPLLLVATAHGNCQVPTGIFGLRLCLGSQSVEHTALAA
jgi:hypothetical protein